MSTPDDLWAQRKAEVEATGGHLEARRIFYGDMSTNVGDVAEAKAEGLYPVVSYKPGDWGNMAAGQSDATLRTLATNLNGLNIPLSVVFHHEPDQQSDPTNVGEGGTAAEFAAMQSHIIDVMKPLCAKCDFAVIMNGWWWTNQARRLTDAEINVWLPASLRQKLDIVAADFYSPESGEEAAVKFRNEAAWARRVGSVKAIGIGETNAFNPPQLNNIFAAAKAEPLLNNGWALVWNSTGDTYRPLTETGLLDDFQNILLHWRD